MDHAPLEHGASEDLPAAQGEGLPELPGRAGRSVVGGEAEGGAVGEEDQGVGGVAEAGRRLGD
jgi:hypothetical protein